MSQSLSAPLFANLFFNTIQTMDQQILELKGHLTELKRSLETAQTQPQLKLAIYELETRIALESRARNAYTPFSRLHPEIIQAIFVFVSHEGWIYTNEVGRATITLTWVCHSWRDHAHHTSELWNYVDFFHPEWVQAALSRTAERQIDFDFRSLRSLSQAPGFTPFFTSCMGKLPYMRSLVMDSMTSTVVHLQSFRLWDVPAPYLQRLSLQKFALPAHLFAGTFPTLRSLNLTDCQFSWDTLRFQPGLKSLIIVCPVSRTFLSVVLEKLQMIGPGIQELELEDTVYPSSTTATPLETPIELSKIRQFQLVGDQAPAITFLLDQLSFPRHHIDNVSVGVSGHPDQINTARALFSARPLEDSDVHWLDITFTDGELSIAIQEDLGNGIIGVARDYDGVSDVVIENVTSITLEMPENVSMLLPVFDFLPMSYIDTINIAGEYGGDDVSALIGRLDAEGGVTEVGIMAFFVPGFTRVLADQVKRLQDLTSGRDLRGIKELGMEEDLKAQCHAVMSFHALETLIYYDHESRFEEEEFLTPIVHREHLDTLHDWLRWRELLGMKLKKFGFKYVVVDAENNATMLYADVVDKIVTEGEGDEDMQL